MDPGLVLSSALILCGALVLALSLVRSSAVLRLLGTALFEDAGRLRRFARMLQTLEIVFLAGYLVVLGCLLAGQHLAGDLLTAGIFLCGAVFVLLTTLLQRDVLESARERYLQAQSLHTGLAQERDEVSRAHEHLVRIIGERRQAETERDRLQAELYQTQKLKALGTLAGGIAHDFNNMLGGILGFAELIKRKYAAANPGLERYATTIIDTSRRAADLTTELLTFARKGALEPGPIDVHDVVDDVAKLLERTIDRRITIVKQLRASPSSVSGDRSRMQNALLNLGLNGRDAMPDGGTLTFASRCLEVAAGGEGVAAELSTGSYVAVAVSDTGTGMSEQTRRHLFEPFFTTKPQGRGTGLGLASVYGTVKDHQGAITVESELGKGSTFTVYLPLQQATAPADAAAPAERPVRGSGRLLLVDDEDVVRAMASEMLREFGYTVTTCVDGQEAVEWFTTHHAEVDLVVLDMMMPRLSGYDCFAQLKQIDPKVRVLVCTGYAQQSETQRLASDGIAGVLRKPFGAASLSKAVAGALMARARSVAAASQSP